MSVLSAAHVIQDQCVEKDRPPCTYSLNTFLCIYHLIWTLECIKSVGWYCGHELSDSDADCVW